MWISLNWIKKLADIPQLSSSELVKKITMSIAEVEGVKESHPHLENIVTAKILEIEKIPETEHLQVTKVTDGVETLQVVCGAPNIEVGDIVPLAKIGAELPSEGESKFVIKKGRLKGVDSFGMLCSARELKLSNDHGGILKLDKNTPLGTKLSQLRDEGDILFEIDNKSITHRPDLWGHLGFAREIAAITDGKLKQSDYADFLTPYKKNDKILNITIEQPQSCRRYSGVVVDNVVVKESSPEIQKALLSVGLTPINNIVDITNYVMLQLGQPMHAFDTQKLDSLDINVRFANSGEKIVALDGKEYSLSDADLVIADNKKAIAIAGVMGGEETKISETTKTILFESANFHAATIRRAANRLGIRTDSSNRFEKSLDPQNTIEALNLACKMLLDSSPEAKILGSVEDVFPTPLDEIKIDITTDYICKNLGVTLSNEFIEKTLTSLSFEILKKDGNSLTLKVPSFRATKDVSIAADIVEEIGRVFGYDNIPDTPFLAEVKPPKYNKERLFEREIKNLFVNRYGFDEIYSYSFVSESSIEKWGDSPERYLGLKNALSQEYTKIRRDLYISALHAVQVNQKNFSEFRFFEVGRGYILENKDSDNLASEERFIMATAVTTDSQRATDIFYEFKDTLQDLFLTFGVTGIQEFIPQNIPSFSHPHRYLTFKRGKEIFATISEIHPKMANRFDISGRVITLEINQKALFEAKKTIKKFEDIAKYPETLLELTVLASERDYVDSIIQIAKKGGKKLIKNVELLTVYKGNPIPEGKKAVSFKITLGLPDRTLKTDEINSTFQSIIADLDKNGFSLRK
ncbi:phenylalanine--tRNA ligase subunit beta [bacterium]|nr:phenylalanine--tRNA ligase subunit beta [bacterium]